MAASIGGRTTLTAQDQDDLSLLFGTDDVDADLSILDALCGMDGHDGDSSGDDESSDGDGLQPKKKRARRTRHELNEIEKQRTRRINEQIQSLRTLLEASGINGKRDKYSVLKNTSIYVQKLKLLLNKTQGQLQALLQKRRQAQQQQQPGVNGNGATDVKPSVDALQTPQPFPQPQPMLPEDIVKTYSELDRAAHSGSMQMLQRPPIASSSVLETGIWAPNKDSMDHLIMFKNASIAMAVANLDGKFVDCNVAFEYISGYSNDEIMKRSVFDLTPPEDCQELMSIVGKMMENPAESAKHFWKRCCFSSRDCHCFVSMWLVRKSSGEPCFFQCAVLPLEDYPSSTKTVMYDSGQTEALAAIEAGPTVDATAANLNALLQPQPAQQAQQPILVKQQQPPSPGLQQEQVMQQTPQVQAPMSMSVSMQQPREPLRPVQATVYQSTSPQMQPEGPSALGITTSTD